MENKLALHTKSCPAKMGRRFLALLLVCVMIFSLSACGGQKTTDKAEGMEPVTVEREPEPLALQTANEAAAIALRQYIYARLATEEFLTAEASSMTMEELSELVDALFLAWEKAELFSSAAGDIADSALALLEGSSLKPTAAAGQPQAKFMTLAATPLSFSLTAYAAGGAKEFDAKTWAESLTQQYDAIKGAKRYQQLAQQLGIDAKAAYEQMVLAQEIIYGGAMEKSERLDLMIKVAQTIKTTSKVAMLGWSMADTGGGSVALLEGTGLLVGGVDCIVDVAETGSTIILGENSQAAVAFGEIKDKLAPVSSVVGLVTLNPAELGKKTKDGVEALVYITDSLVDLLYEDKIVGVKVEGLGLSQHTYRIQGQIFDAGAKIALEAADFFVPSGIKNLTQLAGEYQISAEDAFAKLDTFVSQMEALMQGEEVPVESAPGAQAPESTPPSKVPENAPAGDINIFGRYSVVSRVLNADEEQEETHFVTLLDLGQGKVQWIDEYDEDEDEFEDDDMPIIMSYDASSHKLYYFEEGSIVNVVFTSSGGKVTGKGTMTATLWGERLEATLSLTKTTD